MNSTKKKVAAILIALGVMTLLVYNLQDRGETVNLHLISTNSPNPDMSQLPFQPLPPPQVTTMLSKPITEYHIQVALNAEDKILQGSQLMTWTHPGEQAVNEIALHLYPNAFQSLNTTFNRESGGMLRNDRRKPGSSGEIQIHRIRTANGEDLSSRLQFIQPDDGNKHDHSLALLRLYEPVKPGEQLTLHIEYEVKLPYVYARMGYADQFVMAGQWFPKFAVYEPKNRRGRTKEGWNLHQYHGNSEFYADFSIYSVQIQVPENYIVAASGFPTRHPTVKGGRKTYTFYADDVHDFAWAASPDFIYIEEPFSTKHIPGVKIKLYLDPAHEHLTKRYLHAAKQSLAAYADWFGTYPYSTLSIVVPPAGAGGAGGMEYPTLITAWAADQDSPGLELEQVIAHEIAHQFWYGMIANNEFQEAWLDEAFASYAEDKFMQDEYGIRSSRLLESSYITTPAPLQQHAWMYDSHDQYAENVYLRGKLVLLDIENIIGEQQMRKVLKTYFQEWKFKHPTTRDFQRVLEKVTKQSWEDYFNQFIYDSRMIDFTVVSARSSPITMEGQTAYDNRVFIEAHHGQHISVPIRFGFADGSRKEQEWNGAQGKIEIKIISPSPLQWVMIDPDHTLVLENKHINNFYNVQIEQKRKVQFNFSLSTILETLIRWIAF